MRSTTQLIFLINFSTVEESFGYNILEAMSYSKIVIGAMQVEFPN